MTKPTADEALRAMLVALDALYRVEGAAKALVRAWRQIGFLEGSSYRGEYQRLAELAGAASGALSDALLDPRFEGLVQTALADFGIEGDNEPVNSIAVGGSVRVDDAGKLSREIDSLESVSLHSAAPLEERGVA